MSILKLKILISIAIAIASTRDPLVACRHGCNSPFATVTAAAMVTGRVHVSTDSTRARAYARARDIDIYGARQRTYVYA